MRSLTNRWGTAILIITATAGCGSGSGGTTGPIGAGGTGGSTITGPIQTTSGPYEPLAIGATWTYHVNDQGVLYDKVSTAESSEDVTGQFAGVIAFRVHDVFPNDQQQTWYQVDGLLVKRLRESALTKDGLTTKSEDWYSPYRLRVDETPEHLVAGATWQLPYSDLHKNPAKPDSTAAHTDSFTVNAVDEPIQVPAGAFLSLHITRTDSSDGSTKSFWFVRGVGKVRESTSTSHIEELATYQLP
jgi:hypothetical protein